MPAVSGAALRYGTDPTRNGASGIGSGVAREARGAKILGSVKLNRIAVAVPRPEPRLRARLAVRDSSPEIEIGSEVELGPEFEAALGDELFLDL